jgi:hypothetical protein
MQLILKREKKLNTAKEHFWVIALNNANRILNLELVSLGSTSRTSGGECAGTYGFSVSLRILLSNEDKVSS